MKIIPNYPLREHNSFQIDATAQWWVAFDSIEDLDRLARDEYFVSLDFINLGEGSNTLFVHERVEGVVLHSEICGVSLLPHSAVANEKEEESQIFLRVGSGENWDNLVAYTLEQGYYGLENLSGIPGTVGASVVQNIGAYGSEVGNFVHWVEVYDFDANKLTKLTPEQCRFGYRQSVFKTEAYRRSTIAYVVFALSRTPSTNLSYEALSSHLSEYNISPTPQNIRKAVLQIRKKKLPDHREIPNAGSFFKNPIIDSNLFSQLIRRYPDIPYYTVKDHPEKKKIPSAWLIEKAGLKGYYRDGIGCFETQPLVIVTKKTVKGKEIADFAAFVQKKVYALFSITIEPEVRFIYG